MKKTIITIIFGINLICNNAYANTLKTDELHRLLQEDCPKLFRHLNSSTKNAIDTLRTKMDTSTGEVSRQYSNLYEANIIKFNNMLVLSKKVCETEGREKIKLLAEYSKESWQMTANILQVVVNHKTIQ